MRHTNETAELTETLDAVLAEIHRLHVEPKEHAAPWPSRTLGEIVEDLAATEAEDDARMLIEDPIGGSLRLGLRVIGECLFEIGGIKAMADALDAVELRHPDHAGAIVGFADVHWDGIGQDDDGPGWTP